MALREELQSISHLQSDRLYMATIQKRDRALAANPAITATLQQRDINTGRHFIQTTNGGTNLGSSITTGGMAHGAVLPSVVKNGNHAWIDSRPT